MIRVKIIRVKIMVMVMIRVIVRAIVRVIVMVIMMAMIRMKIMYVNDDSNSNGNDWSENDSESND